MSRLFTFGCSFTQYMWPTWANIVAYDMGAESYNYGVAGLGNVGVHHRIVEADLKHNFTKDDQIMILWTSWCREDRVKNHQWNPAGSVLNFNNGVYDIQFFKKYWDYSNDIVKNSTAIISANKMYGDLIKWQGTAMPLFSTEHPLTDTSSEDLRLIEFYKKRLPVMPIIDTFKNDWSDMAFKAVNDCHPDVAEHMAIVIDYVYKDLAKTLSDQTVERFTSLQKTIENQFNGVCISFDQSRSYIEQTLRLEYKDISQKMDNRGLID